MDYRKKIEDYRPVIKNKRTLKFIEFLDILFEWLDKLYKLKRLRKEQEKEILHYIPQQIFEELDKISPTELSDDKYDEIKIILLREASELINHVINLGKLRMTDFDVVQFNLSQIFKKEEISSMIEMARTHLSDMILEKEEEKLKEQEDKRKAEEEYHRKIMAMPQEELNKLAVRAMFDFAPSARSPQERAEAIKNNQKKLLAQKIKFERFENRLLDATIEAREDAQSMVFRQIRKVKTDMDKVAGRFRKKAKQFVSEEGPKKMIRKSREMILTQRKKLHEELKDKGKDWEKNFMAKTQKAQKRIFGRKEKVHEEIKAKGKDWKENFRKETQKAQEEILKNRKRLLLEEKQRKAFIAKQGKAEIDGAKERMFKGKSDFEKDVEGAREMFAGKKEEIDEARADFTEKRDIAKESFTKRGFEIETAMYGTIYKGRGRFEKERDKARLRFRQKAGEISGHAEGYMAGKKGKFLADREGAQKRFLGRAEEIKGKPKKAIKIAEPEGKADLITGAKEAKSMIEKEHMAMMEKSKLNREKMKQEILHRRDLFLYDVRFARHNMQKHAKQFAEKVAAKREEFGTRGKEVTARHKAKQKAHLIQNLLRTIRSMH